MPFCSGLIINLLTTLVWGPDMPEATQSQQSNCRAEVCPELRLPPFTAPRQTALDGSSAYDTPEKSWYGHSPLMEGYRKH